MKKFIIILFLFIGCGGINSNELDNSFSIENFQKLKIDEQVIFINSLSKSSKFKFLSKFILINDFILPPNEDIRFSNNGKILIFSFTDDGKGHYSNAFWKLEDSKMILWRNNKNAPFPELKREIWSDFLVTKESGKDEGLHFEFQIDKSDDITFLTTRHGKSPYFFNRK